MSSEHLASVQELVNFARETSPYYRQCYVNLPEKDFDLTQIPMVDHTTFWAANTGLPPQNQVLTSAMVDGAVFRTGGTTATPKASYVSREELREGAKGWAACLARAGLQSGDRVANMLYGGDLYKGFLDLGLALTESPVPNIHLSIGVAPLESQAWTIRTYAATFLVAMPTIMCRLAEYLVENNEPAGSIRLLLYIGELLHKDQKILLRKAFPSAGIGPIQYGSVDGGLIGLPVNPPSSTDDDDPTIYTVNWSTMVMELMTDDGQPTEENGVRGSIVITNLERRLMPIIRYPMGDVAEWVDHKSRTFRLYGRGGSVGVRLGPTSYDLTGLKQVVSNVLKTEPMKGFQVIVQRRDAMDEMVFRIASQPQDRDRLAKELQMEMGKVLDYWDEEVKDGFFHPLDVEWVSVQDLIYNSRSGKLREIVDVRVD